MTGPKTDDTLYAFLGNLEKFEDDAGRLHVRGLATDASLDLDGQRCDPVWLKEAMTDWYEWGNVREMHGSNAVGTAVDMKQKGSGWWIETIVVDPGAAEKVKTGVFKGLSIGIKGYGLDKSAHALAMAPNGIINAGKIIEISLVDRPANPNAKIDSFEIAKMVGGVAEGSELLIKEVTVEAMVQTDDAVPCDTCSGIGQVLHEGGTTENFHSCPACNGAGTVGGVDIKPSTNSGPDHEGVVDGDLKAAKPDPDCKTCKGKGTIRGGKVKCPDCVQGKSAIEVLAKMLKESPNLAKAAGMVHDPAVLAAVRDGVIACITTELEELASGKPELWDIAELLGALSAFMSWWSGEFWGGETSDPYEGDNMDLTTLGVSADLIKAAQAEDATNADRSALAEGLLKALGVEDKIALEKSAREELLQKVSGLEATIEQMKTWAAPREIAIRRTTEQKAKAAQVETLESEALSLESSANLIEDRQERAEFMKAAAAIREQVKNLKLQESE